MTDAPPSACQRCAAPIIYDDAGYLFHVVKDQGVVVRRRRGAHGCPSPVLLRPQR